MNESFRLLEGLNLERFTPERAIQEVQRIAGKMMPDMIAVNYMERMEAVATLARTASAKVAAGDGAKNRCECAFLGGCP